jgi:hypothetical protein
MNINPRPLLLLSMLAYLLGLVRHFQLAGQATAGPKRETYWQVEDVRTGMKGEGRTVLKGTRVETFQAEVVGVLRNTSPGRDLVLCRLSGLNLHKTGVIAGMSGSPVYVDGKLLGAVAYAWPAGGPWTEKEGPIAGITPFSQMHSYVQAAEKRDQAQQGRPSRVGLRRPIHAGGRDFDAVTVAGGFDAPPSPDPGLWLAPLQTPLAATGFTPHSLRLLRERCGGLGLVPVQGGGAGARVADEEKDATLEPGGPLAVSLITGDFDLSGIGTVTHIEGTRVYGWGHPFLGLGDCDFPLMTGYIHTVYPRQTVSFKMGSPLKAVGVINADVSTGIAGWIGPKPDLLPLRASVSLGPDGAAKTFNVQIARQRSLLATLVFTALTNSVDMEGELPEEVTADFQARIEIAGHPPVVIKDTFSGFAGGRAPQALYGPVASAITQLVYNPHVPVRIERIECDTQVLPGRRTADIEAVELDAETYAPGDMLRAAVYLRPFKGERRRVSVSLKLPADLPEGRYAATLCDDVTNARLTLRDHPTLGNPTNLEQVLEALRVQTGAKRTHLVLRVPTGPSGVAADGKALPDLPQSMVHILANSRRTGAQAVSGALVARQATDWVIQGNETVRFTVTQNKKTTRGE